MFEQDFIIRAIQQLVQGLLRLKQKKREKKFAEARVELDTLLRNDRGVDAKTLVALPLATALHLSDPPGENEAEKAALIALCLKEYGELHLLEGEEAEARRYFVRAFSMLDELEQRGLGEAVEKHHEVLAWLVGQLE